MPPEIILTKEQKAIIFLARVLDNMPMNDYKTFHTVTDILEIEWFPSKES